MISYKISFDDPVDTAVAMSQLEKNRKTLAHAKSGIQTEVDAKGLKTWDIVTGWYEMSKPLTLHLRGAYGIPNDASNAFFKAIELFRYVDLLSPLPEKFTMFDNASLPGDFIRAANYTFPERVEWRANSLVGGLDDRFGLMRDFPDRWMMTESMSGDVSVQDNRYKIADALGEWRADLYTSDLGFGCKNYDTEEKEHYEAHKGQCMLGLMCLKKGGRFIAKTFTMFNSETIQLLNHMMKQFRHFYVVKPRTSKEDNSECYWMGTGYIGDNEALTALPTFTRSILNITTALTLRQSTKITRNVAAFRAHARVDLRTQVADWCTHFIKIESQKDSKQ